MTALPHEPIASAGPLAGRESGSRRGLWLALIVCLAMQAWLVARSPMLSIDSHTFINMARCFQTEGVGSYTEFNQHPGYPLLILWTQPLVDLLGLHGNESWHWAARSISFIFGPVCVWLVWKLVRSTLDLNAANVAALIFALSPAARHNAADALSDAPHLALYLAAALFALRGAERASPWRFALAGVASGLAFWIRPEGLSAAVVAALLLLICRSWRPQGWRRAWVCEAALVAGSVAVVSPYLLMTGELTAKLTSKRGWNELWREDEDAAANRAQAARERNALRDRNKPRREKRAAAEPSGLVHGAEVSAVDLAASARATAVRPPRRTRHESERGAKDDKELQQITLTERELETDSVAALGMLVARLADSFSYLLLIPIGLYLLPYFQRPFHTPSEMMLRGLSLMHLMLLTSLVLMGGELSRRHFLPLIAVMMPTLACGLCMTGRRLGEWFAWIGSERRATALLIAVLAVAATPCYWSPINREWGHLPRVAAWLRERTAPGDAIMTNSVHIAFEADRPWSLMQPGHRRQSKQLLTRSAASEHRYAVVQLHTDNFDPAWHQYLARNTVRVWQYVGDPDQRQRKVLIYELDPPLAHVARALKPEPPKTNIR